MGHRGPEVSGRFSEEVTTEQVPSEVNRELHTDPSTEALGRGAGHVEKHLEPLSLMCVILRKPAGWQVRRHELRFRNQDPGSHGTAVECGQPGPAEGTGVDVTGKVFPGIAQGQS